MTSTTCFDGWDDTEVDLEKADYSFVGANSGDAAGYFIHSGGDVDGDGLKDILVGAYKANVEAGAVYLILECLSPRYI